MFVVALMFFIFAVISGFASVYFLVVMQPMIAGILVFQGFFWCYLANTMSLPDVQ